MSAMIGARRKRRIQHTLRAYNDGPPEEFRSYYAHAGDRGRHRILPGDAVRFSFRPDESKGYGNPSTKRGIEFFVLPYYDERTRTMHEGVPGISLSKQTKDELREVLNMCLRQRIQVRLDTSLAAGSRLHSTSGWFQVDGLTHELIASAEVAPYYDKNDRKLECATCQGQHATDECRYSCHVCLTKGPRSAHDCMAMERFSNVSQNRGRKEWRRRLEAGKEVYGPFLIQVSVACNEYAKSTTISSRALSKMTDSRVARLLQGTCMF